MLEFLKQVSIIFDENLKQFYVYNDLTPGVYGVGDTKKSAVEEYVSALQDFLLIELKGKYESKAIA